VQAKTTYVASYYASRGRYAATNNYFQQQRDVAPLHAPAGANGVYRYGTSGFPTQSYNSSNYFVDPVFVPSSAVPTPPSSTPPPSTPPTTSGFGWQLSAASTGLSGAGIDRTTLPVFTGTVTAGMTLSRVKITSALDLSSVPNVTLDRVWLKPTDGVRALILGPGTVIRNSDIDASTMGTGERMGIYGNVSTQYAIQGVAMTGVSIGAWLDGNGTGTMTDTYIQAQTNNGAHVDGFTRRSGTGPLLLARDRIDASGPNVTGAFFLQSTWGGSIAGVQVSDTYLEGEGYVVGMSSGSGSGDSTSVSFNNVRIRAVGWGPIATDHRINYLGWNNVLTYDPTRLPGAGSTAIASQ